MFLTLRFRYLIGTTCAFATVLLGGCASAPLPVNYAPSSVKSATGSLTVGAFRYLPAEAAKEPIPPNLIRNTAMGKIAIDRDVKVYVRDAVFAELRVVGVKTNDPDKVLTGDIEEFLVDDLGYSVDWTLRIKYTLTDVHRKVTVYQSRKSLQRHTAKFANAFGALNENIKLSVEQLLDDPAFLRVIAAPGGEGLAEAGGGGGAGLGVSQLNATSSPPSIQVPSAIDDVNAVPVSERGRAAYRDWLLQKKPRAFVISENGWFYPVWGLKAPIPGEPSDPAERALKRCRDAGRPSCRVYAVDDRVLPAANDAR